ncbi:MAG TPA: SPOR domain-containing protein [Roseiarcus sp.]|nr:SPOR domain-containing protein [Roseiarcus sp.]
MNNAKPKPVAEINLEEFERRLRASAAPQAGVEDPLAELTRLVDAIGFERTPSERALEAERASRPKPDLRLAAPPEPPPPEIEPPAAPPPPASVAPPPLVDAEPALRPSFDAEDLDSSAFEPPAPSLAAAQPAGEGSPAFARAESARSRNWGLKVGGLIAAAVVMAGAVVVFKVGSHARRGAPPLILALTTPTKVAPPNDITIRTANESGALLTRDSAQPTPAPPKLVDPPEAPVDLAARPEASALPMASAAAPSPAASATTPSPAASAAAPSPTASAVAPSPTASATAAADPSPVAPSIDTPIVATSAPAAPPPVSADPSRVKTISVRPDGTLISSGYEAAATTAQAAAPTPSPVLLKQADAGAEASSPAVALPTKLAPPKSAARVVSTTETTAPSDSDDSPAPAAPKAKKPKPAVVAEAKGNDDAAAAPSGGGYAVQFATAESESKGKALIRRFQGRFANAIGGAQFAVRKAEHHGKTIYRVRAVGLTRAEANAMCAKVKAAGGDCYPARD